MTHRNAAGAKPTRTHPARRRLTLAWRYRPYTLTISIVLLAPGGLAIWFGDDVSQALSNIASGSISRLMGILLVAGSLVTLTGIIRGRALTEVMGLTLTATGCAIYGIGVLLGLGLHGAVAASGFLAIALATVRRVITLTAITEVGGRDVP